MRNIVVGKWAGFGIMTFLLVAECSCGGGGEGGKNHPPQIISSPLTTATSCELYSYKVKAKDPDYDVLTYRLETAPSGMTINSATGEITWTPTLKQVGNQLVEVSVRDGVTADRQRFVVRVIPLDNGVPFLRGFNLVSWWSEAYLQPESDASLAQLKADGVEWVNILTTWYQETTTSTTISPWEGVTPSDEAVIHAITLAHSLGLKVSLKPHVDVLTGEWRGDISFPAEDEASWDAWFDSYRQFMGHYLDLAEANQVEAVIIGTELQGTEGQQARWRALIAEARTRFSGLLIYGANHDTFFLVFWWDAVDAIGISAYMKLTDDFSPTIEELKAAWAEKLPLLRSISAFYNRDIVFTEIGYMSRDGTNTRPWDYHLVTPPDAQEQADCYQAVLESVYNEPWFKGMFWWAWSWDPTTDDNGYDIYQKPAETILRQWYAGR